MSTYPSLRHRRPSAAAQVAASVLFCCALLAACGPGSTDTSATSSPETASNDPAATATLSDPRTSDTDDDPAALPVQGIDVSHFQGTVDWSEVSAAGIHFAIAKATEGIDYTDPSFAEHWNAKAEVGLIRGAYHFFVAHDDAKTQADFFLSTVDFTSGDLIPIIDFESQGDATTEDAVAGLQVWLDTVEQAVGVRPMIYTSLNFWNSLTTDAFSDYPLWLAEYEETAQVPHGWTTWDLWQYSQEGSVEGVEVSVDVSAFDGTVETLKARLTIP